VIEKMKNKNGQFALRFLRSFVVNKISNVRKREPTPPGGHPSGGGEFSNGWKNWHSVFQGSEEKVPDIGKIGRIRLI